MTVFEVWYAVLLSVRATDGGGGVAISQKFFFAPRRVCSRNSPWLRRGLPSQLEDRILPDGGPPHKIPIFPLHKNENPPTPHKENKRNSLKTDYHAWNQYFLRYDWYKAGPIYFSTNKEYHGGMILWFQVLKLLLKILRNGRDMRNGQDN